jgi:hypothetical protein
MALPESAFRQFIYNGSQRSKLGISDLEIQLTHRTLIPFSTQRVCHQSSSIGIERFVQIGIRDRIAGVTKSIDARKFYF